MAWTTGNISVVVLRDMNERRTLVGPARAHADVSHIAGLDEIVQSLHLVKNTTVRLIPDLCKKPRQKLTVSSIGVS